MNTIAHIPSQNQTASHHVEFFRLPQAGKRDPHFGLSRGWYYKAHAAGEIRMVAVRQRGATRGVRLIVYDSVCDYISRSAQMAKPASLRDASNPMQATVDHVRTASLAR